MQFLDGAWAGIFQGMALVCAIGLVCVWPRPPAPRGELLATAGFCSVAAAVGGRMFWVIVALLRGVEGLRVEHVLDPLRGGFSSFGALGAALILGLLISRRWAASLPALADFFAPIVLLSLSVARLGCLVHGCDFGRQIEAGWGVRYFAHGAPAWQWFTSQDQLLADGGSPHLFPISMVLSAGTMLGVVLLCARARRVSSWGEGALAARLLVMYGVVRVIGELGRHPGAGAHVAGVNLNLVLAAGVIVAGVVMMRVWRAPE